MTLRHLLNQTSGISRADGIAPLLQRSHANIAELARAMSGVALGHPPGERFEYSNLNHVLLGAVLQVAMDQSWDSLVHGRVLRPLAMTHSHTDYDAAARRNDAAASTEIQTVISFVGQGTWAGVPGARGGGR